MRRRKPLPARSLFTKCGDKRATATWVLKEDMWFCESASIHLKWMVGMENFETTKNQLKQRGFQWHWIIPDGKVKLQPPF